MAKVKKEIREKTLVQPDLWEIALIRSYIRKHRPKWPERMSVKVYYGLAHALLDFDLPARDSKSRFRDTVRDHFFEVLRDDPDFSIEFLRWFRKLTRDMSPIRRWFLQESWRPGKREYDAKQIREDILRLYKTESTEEAIRKERETLKKKGIASFMAIDIGRAELYGLSLFRLTRRM